MPIITLPDGKQLTFDRPVSIAEVASQIGAGLAKAALAGKIEDKMWDLSHLIDSDVTLQIITERDPEGLELIRHSTAHLLAQAVKQLYPAAQVTIGPVIENGFYYDFFYEKPFTLDDFAKIEARMAEIVKQDIPVHRKVLSREEAIKYFSSLGEKYKVEIISDLPAGETISLYEQGDFTDLCRGPHLPSTGKIKAFKLMKLAGAYWRGDSNKEMLQRIYGTAWASKKELSDYLMRLEEAEKRDHRKLAKTMDLFHLQEEAPGMIFWHGKGMAIYKTVIQYMRKKLQQYDYQEVMAPLILDRSLWEKSGHWDKFGTNMFTTSSENREYAIKPMNCPGHIQIFNQGLKSYRDLPLRLAEFGICHRNEASGTLHGIMRIREFTQDDAHIFCTPAQLQDEIMTLIKIVQEVYHDFGFDNIVIRLATRPEKRIGDDDVWDRAEKALENALNTQDLPFTWALGEGAFYGPKIEFHLKDCLDRVWQCGTIQVDFSMPMRLGAHYIDEKGDRQVPIMIHRAILGSIERFIGVLIEHYAGNFPLWLSPVQVVIMNITDKQANYVSKLAETLKKQGVRVITDLRNEKIGFKIREHAMQHVPYQLIVGDKELESEQVSVRTQAGEDLGVMTLKAFTDLLA